MVGPCAECKAGVDSVWTQGLGARGSRCLSVPDLGLQLMAPGIAPRNRGCRSQASHNGRRPWAGLRASPAPTLYRQFPQSSKPRRRPCATARASGAHGTAADAGGEGSPAAGGLAGADPVRCAGQPMRAAAEGKNHVPVMADRRAGRMAIFDPSRKGDRLTSACGYSGALMLGHGARAGVGGRQRLRLASGPLRAPGVVRVQWAGGSARGGLGGREGSAAPWSAPVL